MLKFISAHARGGSGDVSTICSSLYLMLGILFLNVDSVDSGQTGLIECTCYFVGFIVRWLGHQFKGMLLSKVLTCMKFLTVWFAILWHTG